MGSSTETLLKDFRDAFKLNVSDEQIKTFLKSKKLQNKERPEEPPSEHKVIIYTDGACVSNGKAYARAGVGIYFENTDQKVSINVKSILEDYFPHLEKNKVTNNIAELLAIHKALILLITSLKNKKVTIEIKTDSMYCIKIFTEWIRNWEKKNWITSTGKPVLNKDIIVEIWKIIKAVPYTIKFTHVPAHLSEPPKPSPRYRDWYGNKTADELAMQGALA